MPPCTDAPLLVALPPGVASAGEGDGECGTNPNLDNCDNSWDVYRVISTAPASPPPPPSPPLSPPPPPLENVALNKPVTTTLSNSFGRDVNEVVDGNIYEYYARDVYSSYSPSGSFTVDLEERFYITQVNVYWSGSWGADTYSFAIVLKDGSSSTTVYETTSAQNQLSRRDLLDLGFLGTATTATSLVLECRGRRGSGYALLELQAMGYTVTPSPPPSPPAMPPPPTSPPPPLAPAPVQTTFSVESYNMEPGWMTGCIGPDGQRCSTYTYPKAYPFTRNRGSTYSSGTGPYNGFGGHGQCARAAAHTPPPKRTQDLRPPHFSDARAHVTQTTMPKRATRDGRVISSASSTTVARARNLVGSYPV